MRLDWEDLRYFLAISREGSLSGAARTLGVHPSTVSRRLESLEAELQGTLFRRSPDGLKATEMALKISGPGRSLQRQVQLIEDLLTGESSKLAGRVRIAVTTTFDEFFLSRQICGLLEKYPDIRPHIISGSALLDLVAGEADIALRFSGVESGPPVPTAQQDELRARLITSIRCYVYASKCYLERQHLDDSACPSELCFITPNQSWMPGADWVKEFIPEENQIASSNYFGGTLDLVQSGIGAAILPSFVASRGCDLVRMKEPGCVDERELWIVWPIDLKRVARVQAVVDFIQECVQGQPPHVFG